MRIKEEQEQIGAGLKVKGEEEAKHVNPVRRKSRFESELELNRNKKHAQIGIKGVKEQNRIQIVKQRYQQNRRKGKVSFHFFVLRICLLFVDLELS